MFPSHDQGGSVINNNNVIQKKEGETANEYLKRVDAEGKTFSFDYISEKDFDEQFMPQGLDTVVYKGPPDKDVTPESEFIRWS